MTESLEPELHDVTHAELKEPATPARSFDRLNDWLRLALFWGLVLVLIGGPIYGIFLQTPPNMYLACGEGTVRREVVVETQQRHPLTQATWTVVQAGYICQPR